MSLGGVAADSALSAPPLIPYDDLAVRLPLIAITLLLASGLAPSQAPGPDHIFVYVDQNGPGPGSGTAADPFLTLLDAMNYVWEHDYVFVRPGIYQEVVNIPYFVFLRSVEGPERTVIDATGLPGTHAVTSGTDSPAA